MAAALLAKRRGLIVLSTTRNHTKSDALRAVGVDHVIIDSGMIADQVPSLIPAGVDCALELVGTPTLPDTLESTRVHGVVCFAGMLSNEWTVKDFYPIDYLPNGVRLTAYSGDAANLPQLVLQEFLDAVAAGEVAVPIFKRYRLGDIVQAHAEMETGPAAGTLVVVNEDSRFPYEHT